MKKLNYRIVGVAVFVIAFISFYTVDVNAAECQYETVNKYYKSTSNYCKKKSIKSHYNLKMSSIGKDSDGNNKYQISINGTTAGTKDTFTVISVDNGTCVGTCVGKTVKKNSAATLKINPDANGDVTVKLKLTKATGNYAQCIGEGANPCVKKFDISGNFEVTLSINYAGDEVYTDLTQNDKNDIINDNKIDNSIINSTNKFNDIIDSAKANHENYNGTFKQLKCNVNSRAESFVTGSNGELKYNYTNKNTFYEKREGEEVKATYNYGYSTNDTDVWDQESKTVCKQTCEEAVIVEYGPPVASKAGFCFQYQVKIRSYVRCNVEVNDNGAPDWGKYKYCSPAPVCENGTSTYIRQGGPNEEFESCIQSCDGGKYSQECSNKCYKEVYSDVSSSNSLALNYSDYKNYVTNISSIKDIKRGKNCNDSDGCYYYSGNKILWAQVNNQTNRGRWYTTEQYKTIWASDAVNGYAPGADGFMRAVHGNDDLCNDKCHWEGCNENEYLNPSDAKADAAANYNEYVTKLNTECKAKASCNESTATFTISVNYIDDEGEWTINYPGGTKTKKGVSSGTTASLSSPSKGNSNTDIVIDWGGCYKEDQDQANYLTEWTFPGTWVHNKTGDISYTKPSNSSSWHKKDNKFCLPLNAKSVNAQWWEWNQLNNGCYSDASGNYNGKSINWNINASVRKFGHFGHSTQDKKDGFSWNFDISCFYAIRNETCDVDDNTKCCNTSNPPSGSSGGGDETCSGVSCGTTFNYSFRNVDTNNLFPATNGSDISDASQTGRTPGFNWSSDATDLSNINYKIDPASLISSIQSRDTSIDDKYLEYRFKLDKITLQKIRNFTDSDSKNNGDYTAFNGRTELKDGIYFYSSPLINTNYGALNTTNNNRYNNYGFYGK